MFSGVGIAEHWADTLISRSNGTMETSLNMSYAK